MHGCLEWVGNPEKTLFFQKYFRFSKMDIYKCPNFISLFTLGKKKVELFAKTLLEHNDLIPEKMIYLLLRYFFSLKNKNKNV
jgi:hypothetical protein